MSEKRFIVETVEITDCDTDVSRIAKVITDTKETYSYEDLYEVAELLNTQQATIEKQNELIKLIANACTYSKEHSVKEILRKEIRGIDTVTEESANAWHDYLILSEFFEEHYKEHWDNE